MNTLLLVWILVAAMFGQEPHKSPASTPLKEYSYPSDGFAIKFPYAPEPHTDSINPDFKVWNIHLSQDAAIAIRSKVDSQPCDVALEKLRSMAKAQNVPIREFSVSRRHTWEEKEHLRGDTMLFERYVCGVGRYYVSLSCGQPRLSVATRIGNNGFFSSRQMTVRRVGDNPDSTQNAGCR